MAIVCIERQGRKANREVAYSLRYKERGVHEEFSYIYIERESCT